MISSPHKTLVPDHSHCAPRWLLLQSFLDLSNETLSLSNWNSAKKPGCTGISLLFRQFLPNFLPFLINPFFHFLLSTNHFILGPTKKKPSLSMSCNLSNLFDSQDTLAQVLVKTLFPWLRGGYPCNQPVESLSSNTLLLYFLLEISLTKILHSNTLASLLYCYLKRLWALWISSLLEDGSIRQTRTFLPTTRFHSRCQTTATWAATLTPWLPRSTETTKSTKCQSTKKHVTTSATSKTKPNFSQRTKSESSGPF